MPGKILTFLIFAFVPAFFYAPGAPSVHHAGAASSVINGLYLLDPSPDYDALNDTIQRYKDSGANTVIIRPVSKTGKVDKQILSKAVFFAHQRGMQLYVILPTRGMTFLLDEHPEWEDMFFDLKTGTIQPSGKLDLLNPHVMVFLSDFLRDIAGYSVDGIILDEDFYYRDTEGLSRTALEKYKRKFNSAFSLRLAFGSLNGESPDNPELNEYGDDFWRLSELKKNNLILLLKNIMSSSKAVNKDIKFGVSLHVPGLFLKQNEILAWYGHDLPAFRKTDLDFFWLGIPHRDRGINTTYRKSMERLSRRAVSSLSLVNNPSSVIIAVQAVSDSGRTLPLSEIEEVSQQVKKSVNVGLTFMVDSDTQLPPVLTRKIFKR